MSRENRRILVQGAPVVDTRPVSRAYGQSCLSTTINCANKAISADQHLPRGNPQIVMEDYICRSKVVQRLDTTPFVSPIT